MKKINLKGISEILSEKELKNVMGGSSGCTRANACCTQGGKNGRCVNVDIYTALGCYTGNDGAGCN